MVEKGTQMKIKKGDAGYVSRHKRNCIIKTVIEFGIVVALFVLGIWQTGDRLNLLTVVAVLGCLPASKALVEVIMIAPHKSILSETEKEIKANAESLTTAFDMVFTSEKKIMPVDCIVISGNTICGYTSKEKVDTNEAAKHIKKYLDSNKYTKVSVKIFDNYKNFLSRIKEMNQLAIEEKEQEKERESGIRRVILNLSL